VEQTRTDDEDTEEQPEERENPRYDNEQYDNNQSHDDIDRHRNPDKPHETTTQEQGRRKENEAREQALRTRPRERAKTHTQEATKDEQNNTTTQQRAGFQGEHRPTTDFKPQPHRHSRATVTTKGRSDQVRRDLQGLKWRNTAEGRCAILCNEPLLHSDDRQWRFRNNTMRKAPSVQLITQAMNSRPDTDRVHVHATIHENWRGTTRTMNNTMCWEDHTSIIALEGQIQVTTEHGDYRADRTSTLQGPARWTADTWETWERSLKPKPKTHIPLIHITPTSDQAIWIELRPRTNMESKDCMDQGCKRHPCGMRHPHTDA
jgi:hypothetical protein